MSTYLDFIVSDDMPLIIGAKAVSHRTSLKCPLNPARDLD